MFTIMASNTDTGGSQTEEPTLAVPPYAPLSPETPPPYQPTSQSDHEHQQQADATSGYLEVPVLNVMPPAYAPLAGNDTEKTELIDPASVVMDGYLGNDRKWPLCGAKGGACCRQKSNPKHRSRTIALVLATLSCALANPLFGAAAFILIMLEGRANDPQTARRLGKASLAVAAVGCVIGPVIIAVTLTMVTRAVRPPGPPCIDCNLPDWEPYRGPDGLDPLPQDPLAADGTLETPVPDAWAAARGHHGHHGGGHRGRWRHRSTVGPPTDGGCVGYLVHGVCYGGRYKAHCYAGGNCCTVPTQRYYAGFCYFVSSSSSRRGGGGRKSG